MEEGARCWVCLRNNGDISAAGGIEAREDARIQTSLLEVTRRRSRFRKSSELWTKAVPAEFMGAEIEFVLNNPEEFKSIRVLDEISQAKSLMDRLGKALADVRAGDRVSLEVVQLRPSRLEEREILTSRLAAFEEQTHRRLPNGSEDGGRGNDYPMGLKGLSTADGLAFLGGVGILYFDLQIQLLEWERSTRMAKRQVGYVQLEGLPDVPVCGICQGLLGKTHLDKRIASGHVQWAPVVAPTTKASSSRPRWPGLSILALALAVASEVVLATLLIVSVA